MSYVKGSQLPVTSTVADTDTLIVTQEGDSKATKKATKSDLLKEDRTRLTNLERENTTLKNNIKALEYVINNSNRLNYTGEVITNSNSVVGDIKNVTVSGNTRYKKTDGTYTYTWESGVSLESMGEKEKNSNGKYPIEVVSNSNVLNVRDSNAIISGSLIEYLENNSIKITSLTGIYNFVKYNIILRKNVKYILHVKAISNNGTMGVFIINNEKTNAIRKDFSVTTTFDIEFTPTEENNTITFYSSNGEKGQVYTFEDIKLAKCDDINKENKRTILLDSPLRKVGAIADILDLDKSQVIRKSHKIVLDNNIEGYETNSKNGKKGYNITLSKKAKDGKLICDKLPVVNEYIVWEETIGIYIKNNEIIIYHNGESLTDFKTWLASNPITVVYELATPTTEDIQVSPTDNPLTSYTPSTTLTTNNTIKGNISADMPTNLSGVITQQASLIAQLEDNLLQTQALLIDNAIDNA